MCQKLHIHLFAKAVETELYKIFYTQNTLNDLKYHLTLERPATPTLLERPSGQNNRKYKLYTVPQNISFLT